MSVRGPRLADGYTRFQRNRQERDDEPGDIRQEHGRCDPSAWLWIISDRAKSSSQRHLWQLVGNAAQRTRHPLDSLIYSTLQPFSPLIPTRTCHKQTATIIEEKASNLFYPILLPSPTRPLPAIDPKNPTHHSPTWVYHTLQPRSWLPSLSCKSLSPVLP